MNLSVALLKERLVAALASTGDVPERLMTRWTAERVSEYLRACLDVEQPEEGGTD